MKFKTLDDKASVITGVIGLGMVLIGGAMYLRARSTGLSGGYGLGRGRVLQQAPVIDSYSDGTMKTVMRASANMPIEQRIATIQEMIYKGVKNPRMIKLARQITRNCPERDQMCEARAIYNFTKQHVRYTGDIGPVLHPDGRVEGIDLYPTGERTLEFGGEDCDGQAILNATLLANNGHEGILRVVKERGADDWQHIYVGSKIRNRFVALDTTLPGTDKFDYEQKTHKQIDFPV